MTRDLIGTRNGHGSAAEEPPDLEVVLRFRIIHNNESSVSRIALVEVASSQSVSVFRKEQGIPTS